jgi:N-methylhydantoinase A
MPFAVAVDIGGTFTDLVAYDHETHQVAFTKSPTTYGNFVEGILACFDKAGLGARDANFLNHGTTLVINALIQRKGSKSALVTTRGFRDILEIARGNRPDPFDLTYHRDEPLIPRERRHEVAERMSAAGEIVTPLDVSELEAVAHRCREGGIESVAVFFMNSYANPAHEREAGELLRKWLPGCYVTCSTELTREWYEYERTSTVAANAFVGPIVDTYIRRLEADLEQGGFSGSLFMMGSNGGLLSVDRTCRQPIALVESGPIGGCIGASAYAEALGIKNVIAFDMGGTTAKCALVDEGRFSVESIYYAGGYVKGFPIRSPVIDIVEVGSGGGSIAWLDPQNRLHVGPQSAGSTPGPVCYGRGGTQPTVTDANLVLGRLNPQRFLGGELTLDLPGARAAIERIAAPLGYAGDEGLTRMAEGILSISTVIMAGAIKQISVEHGLDPRDFVLFCYGGGGPLHGSALARELKIPTVVIPAEPGNFSAIGMLLADARLDLSKTFTGRLEEAQVTAVRDLFAALEAEARAELSAEFGAADVFFEHHLEMRYVGQRHNIKVPIDSLEGVEAIRAAFDRDYRRRYGHADAQAPAEIQAVHLSAFSRQRRPDLARLPRVSGAAPAPTRRPVYFGATDGFADATVYDRASLSPGFRAEGPALIEEYGSTTLVAPGDRFEIGTLSEIRISVGG